MDVHALLQINGWLSLIMFGMTVLAILNPRVRDGIVIKFGLILMCFGYLGCASGLVEGMTYQLVFSSWIFTNLGLLVALAGWLYRSSKDSDGPRRRRTDVVHSSASKSDTALKYSISVLT
jgi:hypothetical protein